MATVLIAEDEVVIAMMLSDMVEAIGHSVVGRTRTGKETVESAKDRRPDIVLLDISMDYEEDGIDACKAIKEESPDIKIVFMTAYPEQSLEKTLKRISYDGYIEKPARLHTIQQKLKEIGI
jgi:CheY-like chemotaxis protein